MHIHYIGFGYPIRITCMDGCKLQLYGYVCGVPYLTVKFTQNTENPNGLCMDVLSCTLVAIVFKEDYDPSHSPPPSSPVLTEAAIKCS